MPARGDVVVGPEKVKVLVRTLRVRRGRAVGYAARRGAARGRVHW
nr:hypothetical protein [Cellulosimicrobium sp. MM]